ncbi:MAG: HAD family phosphatase [Actinomycetota bacterium]|nr:HAD family phosphatase [Actinomycetota bacterium]
MPQLEAVLFDMDGLLVDTEPIWTVAEVELARQLGGEFTPELKAAIVGTPLEVAVPTILRWYGGPTDDATVTRTMRWLLVRMVELFEQRPPIQPGVEELLMALAAAGIPTALVSSSYRVLVDAVLSHGVGPFDLTLAGDEVRQGKPHPEPYLTAASRLGVDPRRCVVLEDSPAGVASAEAAGCAVVAVPSVEGIEFATTSGRLVLSSLADLRLSDLAALLTAAA